MTEKMLTVKMMMFMRLFAVMMMMTMTMTRQNCQRLAGEKFGADSVRSEILMTVDVEIRMMAMIVMITVVLVTVMIRGGVGVINLNVSFELTKAGKLRKWVDHDAGEVRFNMMMLLMVLNHRSLMMMLISIMMTIMGLT